MLLPSFAWYLLPAAPYNCCLTEHGDITVSVAMEADNNKQSMVRCCLHLTMAARHWLALNAM